MKLKIIAITTLLMILALSCMTAFAEESTEDFIYVSDLEWTSWVMYESSSDDETPKYRPTANMNEAGTVIIINGIEYPKGLRSHPQVDGPGDIVYDISAYDYEYFTATVGRDSASVGGGLVSFEVIADGESVAESPELTLEEDYFIVANIKGCKELTLRINHVDGCAHDSSAWGSPKLVNLAVEKLEIAETPFKLTYKIGEELNLSGGKLSVFIEGGIETSIDITNDMISGFDSATAGEKNLTVTYKDKTVSFNVNIEEAVTPAPTATLEPSKAPTSKIPTEDTNGGNTSLIIAIVAIAVVVIAVIVVIVIKKKK